MLVFIPFPSCGFKLSHVHNNTALTAYICVSRFVFFVCLLPLARSGSPSVSRKTCFFCSCWVVSCLFLSPPPSLLRGWCWFSGTASIVGILTIPCLFSPFVFFQGRFSREFFFFFFFGGGGALTFITRRWGTGAAIPCMLQTRHDCAIMTGSIMVR